MPLGFFSGGGGGVKPQQLANQSSDAGSGGASECKDGKGAVISLPKHTVYLERKLAEGGFAIVYLAGDKSNRQYALKRQFISDDLRQLEACKRECRIVSCLSGHKNIVEYVDHAILKNRTGVYEYSLLTAYYKNSVLQLMNERLLAGRCLSAKEILSIFCDMCEAVARLHHSQTPVIHRDLKVENVLIDERCRGSPPRYVLCDFGSATTKVLSTKTHALQFIEEEIQRYTTLSYRAPEMIDLYSGRPIGTKIDIWAMGVMLYKLCYFVLPFGESALAIQNCTFSFPSEPKYPDELRALIKVILESDIDRRPDIFQTSSLAFEAANLRSPVGNLNKVQRIPLCDALRALRDEVPLDGKSLRPAECSSSSKGDTAVAVRLEQTVVKSDAQAGGITSVNPRLRPKPTTGPLRFPQASAFPPTSREIAAASPAQQLVLQSGALRQQNSFSNPDIGPTSEIEESATMWKSDHSAGEVPRHFAAPAGFNATELGFKDLEEFSGRGAIDAAGGGSKSFRDASPVVGPVDLGDSSFSPPLFVDRDYYSTHASAPQLSEESCDDGMAVTSRCKGSGGGGEIGGSLRSSAFKPYSVTNSKGNMSSRGGSELEGDVDATDDALTGRIDKVVLNLGSNTAKWNPFAAAPFEWEKSGRDFRRTVMDDRSFGQCFDELPRSNRRGSLSSTANVKSRESLVMAVDEADPFGAAPFHELQVGDSFSSKKGDKRTSSKTGEPASVYPHLGAARVAPGDESDSIGSTSDLRFRAHANSGADDCESESEEEAENRDDANQMSYEHFYGDREYVSSESNDAVEDAINGDESPGKDGTVKWLCGKSQGVSEFLVPTEGTTFLPLLADCDDTEELSSIGAHLISASSSGAPLLPQSATCHDSFSSGLPVASVSSPVVERRSKHFDSVCHIEAGPSECHSMTNPFTTSPPALLGARPAVLPTLPPCFPRKDIFPLDVVCAPLTSMSQPAVAERSSGYINKGADEDYKISVHPSKRASNTVLEVTSSGCCGAAPSTSPQPPQSAPAVVGDVDLRQHAAASTASVGAFDAITAFIAPREKSKTKAVSSKRDLLLSPNSSTSSDDSPLADSGTEMFLSGVRSKAHSSKARSHRKKVGVAGSGSRAIGSTSSMVDQAGGASVKLSPLLKKYSGKRHGSTSSKRSSQGMLDAASFVNNSFQAEDWESKPGASCASPRSPLTQPS